MSQANEIKLPDGITYSLNMLNQRALELATESQKVSGAVQTILAPFVPDGDQPTDWLIQPRQDGSVYLVKRQAPPNVPTPAPASTLEA